jgi:hypothetical protein
VTRVFGAFDVVDPESAADWERRRHAAECRYWLDRGYTTREKVDVLIQRIAQRRGRERAERVREGMREEFQRRKEARDG